MFTILHGEDEFDRAQEVLRIKKQAAQPGLGDLNITVLDGRRLSLAELMNACSALPFFTSSKLVVVENMLQRYGARASGSGQGASGEGEAPTEAEEETPAPDDKRGRTKAEAAQLAAYLSTIPPSTHLVFSDDKALAASNPILRLAKGQGPEAVREFARLNARSSQDRGILSKWIADRAKGYGVEIRPEAAAALITLVGGDKRAVDSELQKLAGFVGYARPITAADVQALTSLAVEAVVFDLVDALGRRERKVALDTLARLYKDEAQELGVLAMLARQIRLLIATQELVQEQNARPTEVAKAVHVQEWIAQKLLAQVQGFDAPTLDRLLRRILEVDQGIKTGRIQGRLGMELLILEACQRRRTGVPQAPTR